MMRVGRLRSTRTLASFITLVSSVCPHAAPRDDRRGRRESKARMDEGLYSPVEEEVRAEYQRDLANQKVQTWREYWELGAGVLQWQPPGRWLDQVQPDDPRRGQGGGCSAATLLKKINRLGKLISQEWAKHDSVRKITTTDLKRWNDALTEARRVETTAAGSTTIADRSSKRFGARSSSGRSVASSLRSFQ